MIEVIVQQLVNGIVIGLIYALVASGLSMMYGVAGIVNFAHGEFYMLGAYITVVLFGILDSAYLLALIVTVLLSAVLGLLFSKAIILPLFTRKFEAVIIATLGLSIFLQNMVILLMSARPRTVTYRLPTIEILGVYISGQRLIIAFSCIALFVVLNWFIKSTRTGKAMRAMSQNMEGAKVIGINVNRICVVSVAISIALAGFAGGLVAPIFSIVPAMGIAINLKAFAAVIMGGMGNVKGAIYSGLLIGVAETVISGFFFSFKDAFAFLIIIFVLLLKPEGIFGKKVGI